MDFDFRRFDRLAAVFSSALFLWLCGWFVYTIVILWTGDAGAVPVALWPAIAVALLVTLVGIIVMFRNLWAILASVWRP